MSDGLKPIDFLLNRADMRCTICESKLGMCDCWTKCDCGWSYKKEGACRNPEHKVSPQASEVESE